MCFYREQWPHPQYTAKCPPLSLNHIWPLHQLCNLKPLHLVNGLPLMPCSVATLIISCLFKGAGSLNRKQTCYLYALYCCLHMAIVFHSDFGGWSESTIKLLLKIHQYLCNPTTYECLVCFSRKFKSSSSK